MDLSAQLFIKSKHKITSVEVEPTAAITIRETQATTTGWKHYALAGHKWGRARVLLSYDDGSKQSINYYVIKPAGPGGVRLGQLPVDEAMVRRCR